MTMATQLRRVSILFICAAFASMAFGAFLVIGASIGAPNHRLSTTGLVFFLQGIAVLGVGSAYLSISKLAEQQEAQVTAMRERIDELERLMRPEPDTRIRKAP